MDGGFSGDESSFKKTKMDDTDTIDFSKTSDWRDWSGLPTDVVFIIADNLTAIDDFVRFGAVCASWRTIFHQNKNHASSLSSPFLYIAPLDDEDKNLTVRYLQRRYAYSPGNKRVHDLRFQVPLTQICCGSSFGWLITLEDRGRRYYVQLQNPFLNQSIDLPRLEDIFLQSTDRITSLLQQPGGLDAIVQQPDHPLLPHLENGLARHLHDVFEVPPRAPLPPRPFDFLRKAALSEDPSSTTFVAVGIVSKLCSLAFFKSGDENWTPLNWGEEVRSFSDVIYFHRTKQFYAALSDGEVLAIDFVGGGLDPKFTRVAPPNRGFKDMVLVEDLSSGDLYQVGNEIITCMDWRRIEPFSKFNIFKLDAAEEKWKRVHNLGDNVLFFGYNCSMLRPAANCPGCEPNCVYFITYPRGCMNEQYYYEPPYAGIYNLEDSSIRPLYTQTLPSAIWLLPTLC